MQKAIIVGATSGIGRQMALLLAEKNYVIGITGRRKLLLDELKNQKPEHFAVADFDIVDGSEVFKKLDQLASILGKVDLLILSAGTGEINESLDLETEKRTLEVNVLGFTAVANWALHYFQQQQAGHFAAITSVAGLRGSRLA